MGVPLLRFLAHVDGLRGEMLESGQETVQGSVFFLHAELRRQRRGKEQRRFLFSFFLLEESKEESDGAEEGGSPGTQHQCTKAGPRGPAAETLVAGPEAV